MRACADCLFSNCFARPCVLEFLGAGGRRRKSCPAGEGWLPASWRRQQSSISPLRAAGAALRHQLLAATIPKLHAASTGRRRFHGRIRTGAAHNGRLFATAHATVQRSCWQREGRASASLVARYALAEAEDATMTAWLLVMVISNPQGYISVPNIASKQECERLAVEISAGIRSVYRCIEYRIGGSTIKWDGPIVGGVIGAP